MPVDVKPLFRPDALRPQLRAFSWPDNIDEIRSIVGKWAEMFRSERGNKFKEKELLPDFLTDIFCSVLGYSRPADDSEHYTLSREKHVQVDGKFADAVLGHFRPDGFTPIIALEGKGPKDPLDRPYGRKMSAVDQGYRYAINLPCDWIIVTSMRQTRLYSKLTDQYTFERFDIIDLSTDDKLLKRFLFLVGAERVAPESGENHLTTLLSKSEKVGKELTKEFYFRYAEMRQAAFEQLCAENPDIPQSELLTATQKLLDRILFCAFCEDRGLLPANTIRDAYEYRNPYRPGPIWDTFRELFRAIDKGNSKLKIPEYNGGLFAEDSLIDNLNLTDEVCQYFQELGEYDYRPAGQVSLEDESGGQLIDVDILGHIFEQSISDLERLRNVLEGKEEALSRDKLTSRRKKEGAFYTPAFITRYIVEQALGSVLQDRFEAFRAKRQAKAKGTSKTVLADPTVYDLDKLNSPQRKALIGFWENWQEELKTVRVLDPACGSGAFLIEVFDQLHKVYDESNERLLELRGTRSLFDPDTRILQHNLYGVDLNEEAIEICRLSLWIKTAARGKKLTSLDHTIHIGNSVVSDGDVHPKAFDWQAAFPEVFDAGGFDVVVGNPPYVRQELLSPIKRYLEENYDSYHGMADLYVYFYELGCRLLKPGGRLSYIVTNKWMKASYGEPLRKFFSESVWTESVIDFGHAKQIFEDADVFPSIIVVRRPNEETRPKTLRSCSIPRDTLRIDDLSRQIDEEGFDVESQSFGAAAWTLDSPLVNDLLNKVETGRSSLLEYSFQKPQFGIKTGFNVAYLIDTATKNVLVAQHPPCEAVIKPYLRGKDVRRWRPVENGLWIILLKSSANAAWSWSKCSSELEAEPLFAKQFPSIYRHMKEHEKRLRARSDQGLFWWELRSCAYYESFDQEKIVWQDLSYHSRFALCDPGIVPEATCFSLATNDAWMLCVLNSAIMWMWLWSRTIHGKDEALRLKNVYTEGIPIPCPTPYSLGQAAQLSKRLCLVAEEQVHSCNTLLDWLKVEFEVVKPTKRLQDPVSLDSDALVKEVKKIRGKKNPLSAAALKALRDEYVRTIEPAQRLQAEALQLEYEINDLVNEAYGLTPEEVKLMWDTAPPRMPIPRPSG